MPPCPTIYLTFSTSPLGCDMDIEIIYIPAPPTGHQLKAVRAYNNPLKETCWKVLVLCRQSEPIPFDSSEGHRTSLANSRSPKTTVLGADHDHDHPLRPRSCGTLWARSWANTTLFLLTSTSWDASRTHLDNNTLRSGGSRKRAEQIGLGAPVFRPW